MILGIRLVWMFFIRLCHANIFASKRSTQKSFRENQIHEVRFCIIQSITSFTRHTKTLHAIHINDPLYIALILTVI